MKNYSLFLLLCLAIIGCGSMLKVERYRNDFNYTDADYIKYEGDVLSCLGKDGEISDFLSFSLNAEMCKYGGTESYFVNLESMGKSGIYFEPSFGDNLIIKLNENNNIELSCTYITTITYTSPYFESVNRLLDSLQLLTVEARYELNKEQLKMISQAEQIELYIHTITDIYYRKLDTKTISDINKFYRKYCER